MYYVEVIGELDVVKTIPNWVMIHQIGAEYDPVKGWVGVYRVFIEPNDFLYKFWLERYGKALVTWEYSN